MVRDHGNVRENLLLALDTLRTHKFRSFLTILGEGAAIEVATVGDEGMLGLPAVLADAPSSHETIIQIPGEAQRMIGAAKIPAIKTYAKARRGNT